MAENLPKRVGNVVRARCPDCEGAVSNFSLLVDGRTVLLRQDMGEARRRDWMFASCNGCGRGAVLCTTNEMPSGPGVTKDYLRDFWPMCLERYVLPERTPDGIRKEFEESEKCAEIGAYRAALALARSALEKALVDTGYKVSNLYDMVNAAANDGVFTESLRKKANTVVKDKGNDVLHGKWRVVSADEVRESQRYTYRCIEELYDDRDTVMEVLRGARGEGDAEKGAE